MTEQKYLKQQADNAKANSRKSLDHLLHEVGHELNPAAWTRKHPKSAISAAAALAFSAAALLKRPRIKIKINASTNGSGNHETSANSAHESSPESSAKPEPGLAAHFLHELIGLAGLVLRKVLTAALDPKPAARPAPSAENQPDRPL